MAKYRKKPVIIEAFELGYHWPQDECNDWFFDAVTSGVIRTQNMGKVYDPNKPPYIEINTLEGVMRGDKGDFIVKGVNGEIYPCKPDIFAKTYDEVRPVDTQGGDDYREIMYNGWLAQQKAKEVNK